jgi:hypothetical protein
LRHALTSTTFARDAIRQPKLHGLRLIVHFATRRCKALEKAFGASFGRLLASIPKA